MARVQTDGSLTSTNEVTIKTGTTGKTFFGELAVSPVDSTPGLTITVKINDKCLFKPGQLLGTGYRGTIGIGSGNTLKLQTNQANKVHWVLWGTEV